MNANKETISVDIVLREHPLRLLKDNTEYEPIFVWELIDNDIENDTSVWECLNNDNVINCKSLNPDIIALLDKFNKNDTHNKSLIMNYVGPAYLEDIMVYIYRFKYIFKSSKKGE